MKRRTFAFLMAISLFSFGMISCSKDDEKKVDEVKISDIYGRWMHIEYGLYDIKTLTIVEGEDNGVNDLIFNEDGTGSFDGEESFTWKNEQYPNHLIFSGYAFKLNKVAEDEFILLDDPAVSENQYEEGFSFGVHIKKGSSL